MASRCDPAALVEVDRDHPLVGDVLRHEGELLLGALRDVIERLAADGGDGGGRAEHDQHLLLAGAERNLLQRAFGQDVAALIDLGERVAAAAERQAPPQPTSATASSPDRCARPRYRSNRLFGTVISLASRASAGLPEVPRNSNEQLNAAAARPANPMISLPFRRSRQTPNIDALYGMIVAQARSPAFYRGYGVPDTVDGRLDMIVLHLVLLLRQLAKAQGTVRGAVPPARPAAVRPVLPGHRRQLPRNGGGRPRGAQGDAARGGGVLRPRQGLRKRARRRRCGGARGGGRPQCVRRQPSRRWARGAWLPICARRAGGSARRTPDALARAELDFPDPEAMAAPPAGRPNP